MAQSVLEMTKDLVKAQIEARRITVEEMHEVLQKTFESLVKLKQLEETGTLTPGEQLQAVKTSADWRKSIGKRVVTCLECGAKYKQLSVRHLREHGLDGRSYRAKYGIPPTQALSARDTTATRKQIAQKTRPWEKAPTYRKAQEDGKTQVAKKGTRKRSGSKKGPTQR